MKLPPIRYLILLLLLGACARLPGEAAQGTPAAHVAATGFAQLLRDGAPLGSAVAIAPNRLLTNAHVLTTHMLPTGGAPLQARRGDGAVTLAAVPVLVGQGIDLAVLEVAEPAFTPPPLAAGLPAAGAPIWAVGTPLAGPPVAAGHALAPAALAGRGEGFIARLPALAGYSGGPVVDAGGASPGPGHRPAAGRRRAAARHARGRGCGGPGARGGGAGGIRARLARDRAGPCRGCIPPTIKVPGKPRGTACSAR